MDIVTSIPARVKRLDSMSPLLEQVYERVARRAYENFTDRDYAHGLDLEDWIAAERELIVRPAAETRVHGEDIVVDVTLPGIDFQNLIVHVSPLRLLVESETDEAGRQIFLVIDLPQEICVDGVDAEQMRNALRVTAAIAKVYEPQFV